jgi:hypothetical protein
MWRRRLADSISEVNKIRLKRLGNRVIRLFENPNSLFFKSDAKLVLSYDRRDVFFGYYDISPFSNDETMVLATHTARSFQTPSSKTPLLIGYYSLIDSNRFFQKVASTDSWCWQQGCRLQWFPDESNRMVMYNTMLGAKYGAAVLDIRSKKIDKTYTRPLYAISNDGKWGLSLNFSRLQRLRPGYGYSNLPDETQNQYCPMDDGIWRIDLETGEEKLIHSLSNVAAIDPSDCMREAEHYFNHLCFNPTGNRLMFFHIWVRNKKRKIRLFTSDIDGKNIHILNGEGHVSHYTWKSEHELLVFGTHVRNGSQYYLYQDQTMSHSVVGEGVFHEDGHPSYTSDKDWIITDQYPDKYGDQHLLLYNCLTKKILMLGKFYSPAKFSGEVRCDLHPRLSPSGNLVCIDSSRSGKREMIILSLKPWLETG